MYIQWRSSASGEIHIVYARYFFFPQVVKTIIVFATKKDQRRILLLLDKVYDCIVA